MKNAIALIFIFAGISAAQFNTQPDVVRNYGQGGRVDWCPTSNKIAFDELMTDPTGKTGSWFDVVTADIDSTGALSNLHDLSFNSPYLPSHPRKHVGNPAFSMDCNLMAIQVESDAEPCASGSNPSNCEEKASPGNGLYNDLYICTLNSQRTAFLGCTQVTHVSMAAVKPNATPGGVLHPVFSHDSPSSRVCWGEMTGLGSMTGTDSAGIWEIGCSTLSYTGGVLSEVNTPKYVQPTVAGGQQKFYEFGSSGGRFGTTYGFEDDGWLYFVGNLKAGQAGNDYNVYRYNWFHKILQPLSNDSNVWNELPHIAPTGQSLIFSSVRDNPAWTNAAGQAPLLDLWKMQLPAPTDVTSLGSDLAALTAYNVPGSPTYNATRLSMADQAWSPDGTAFIVCAAHPELEGVVYMKVH